MHTPVREAYNAWEQWFEEMRIGSRIEGCWAEEIEVEGRPWNVLRRAFDWVGEPTRWCKV